VVDVGAGSGLLVAEMAEQVGPTGHVIGLDIAQSMVTIAQRRCAQEPIRSRTTIIQGDAIDLPFCDEAFDAAVSTQVYEYVSDIGAALTELHRVLRPGGRALILDTDWDSVVWHAHDQARMRRILAAWNERFADPYLPRTLTRHLRDVGFEVHRRDVLVLFNPNAVGLGYWRSGSVRRPEVITLGCRAPDRPSHQSHRACRIGSRSGC
jgi:arsenite methyltransferase